MRLGSRAQVGLNYHLTYGAYYAWALVSGGDLAERGVLAVELLDHVLGAFGHLLGEGLLLLLLGHHSVHF